LVDNSRLGTLPCRRAYGARMLPAGAGGRWRGPHRAVSLVVV